MKDEFKVYHIEIVVTDPDVNENRLRWLLEEAGDVQQIRVG
jgi:hypothetical protein